MSAPYERWPSPSSPSDNPLGGVRVHVGDDYARAFFGEPRGDRLPDAGPATGDDDAPASRAPHEAFPLNQIMPDLLLPFALPLPNSLAALLSPG